MRSPKRTNSPSASVRIAERNVLAVTDAGMMSGMEQGDSSVVALQSAGGDSPFFCRVFFCKNAGCDI